MSTSQTPLERLTRYNEADEAEARELERRARRFAAEDHPGGRIGCNHAGGICSDLDRVADAIARKRGAGPLHLMPESSAGQYRAMARAAMDVTADMLAERMEGFYKGGVHTRAGWAVAMIRVWTGREQ